MADFPDRPNIKDPAARTAVDAWMDNVATCGRLPGRTAMLTKSEDQPVRWLLLTKRGAVMMIIVRVGIAAVIATAIVTDVDAAVRRHKHRTGGNHEILVTNCVVFPQCDPAFDCSLYGVGVYRHCDTVRQPAARTGGYREPSR